MVPGAGLEPAWPQGRGILSPLRLPISPPGHQYQIMERMIAQRDQQRMEARVGIEPAYTALQAAA